MFNISRWQRFFILLVVAGAMLIALPNAFYKRVEDSNDARARLVAAEAQEVDAEQAVAWPTWLPSQLVNLGLDLRGGVHLLVEVQTQDVHKERYEELWITARDLLHAKSDVYGNIRRGTPENGIQLVIEHVENTAFAIEEIQDQLEALGSNAFAITPTDTPGEIDVNLLPGEILRLDTMTMARSIEIIRRRIDAAGTKEPTIQRLGENRISIDVPGFNSADDVLSLLGRTAKLTLHQVFEATEDKNTRINFDELLLPDASNQEGLEVFYRVARVPHVTGDQITDASPSFNQQTNEPIVSFSLNNQGAKAFGNFTSEHVGEPFAIVLDGEVISAPRINEVILGGSAQISGNFTPKETTELAVLLRSGALPAELVVLEQSTVGPDLGQDSVDAGKLAFIVAFVLIVLYMIWSYRIFGLFAATSLTVNVVMIFAALSVVGSTLTLPGIAGIVLTIGMAVDANVIIFERVREEISKGVSLVLALDQGFARALTSIVDANVTTIIAAAVLYFFGSGPVRGFAITLMIGVMCSLFTAIYLTRLMIVFYVDRRKPQSLKFLGGERV